MAAMLLAFALGGITDPTQGLLHSAALLGQQQLRLLEPVLRVKPAMQVNTALAGHQLRSAQVGQRQTCPAQTRLHSASHVHQGSFHLQGAAAVTL